MTNLELVLNMLAETSTTEISKKEKPNTFPENRKVAKMGKIFVILFNLVLAITLFIVGLRILR